MPSQTPEVDVVIVGGGVAGLWLLDELMRAGYQVLLLEAEKLGHGQTVAAQGIIHGGLKYALDELFSPSAEAIKDMPLVWRECRSGARAPDLRAVKLRSEFCHLWRSDSLRSRLGMVGARAGLRVTPIKLRAREVPPVLSGCPGEVYRIDEQVVDPASLLEALAGPHRERLLRIDGREGVEWGLGRPGRVERLRLRAPGGRAADLEVCPRTVVFTAGCGNAALREQVGLEPRLMQRRPLRMVMLRGDLPWLNGHCTDGAKTRVTISSSHDRAGRCVWQVGGQVSEDGVAMTAEDVVRHARRELSAVLPGVSFAGVEWSSYLIDRAEAARPGGKRPTDASSVAEGNVITAWPTKLALAPRLAEQIRGSLAPPAASGLAPSALAGWPRPELAAPPWEGPGPWFADP